MGQVSSQLERRQRPGASTVGSARLGTYLRRLREGYGYTLRRVEEQSLAFGEAIDNSQLSRFEKGKAVPSFEKLRALARVFNVPVQSFADVLDLEEYARLAPQTDDYAELLRIGAESIAHGEPGRAWAAFDRALAVADEIDDEGRRAELAAEARWRVACALKSLGKLFMTEQELRGILKQRHLLAPRSRLRALLQLAYLYRELGDLYLASVLARECLELAIELDDAFSRAGVLNTLGNILNDEGRLPEAVDHYREALAALGAAEGQDEMRATVQTNLGGCLAAVGRFEEGVVELRAAHARACEGGLRRVAALALTRLAECWVRQGDPAQARRLFGESDAAATRPDGTFHDILFLNAFHRWKMEQTAGNGTGERIAFGRLRHLRSLLQRRFVEVDEFDRHVERTRR